MGKNFVPYNACRKPQVIEVAAYMDPMAKCYRRIRNACLMDDLSQAQKVAALELVKAELLHDMLAAILPEREP